ncbi:hypothetical protein HanLR1_Chr16g0612821 [Helianthus annuus]|nr:hypothetical protein HanLR1_Chr16g0612821 [Helianthus annuus]
MLKYTSVFYDLMMKSWPYTCVDQWPGFVHSVRKYTSVHSRTPPLEIKHNLNLVICLVYLKQAMLDHVIPLMDDSWPVKFERVREDGFSRLQAFWVLREIVIPIKIIKLLTALCVPYVLARGVFPVFGYPLVVNSAVYRFAWLGCLGLSFLCFCAKRFHVWFTNLHNSIRDDRYLIGRRLHNFGEDNTQREVQTANVLDPDTDVGLRHRRNILIQG